MTEFVLIGVPDSEMKQNHASWSTNKIGGFPDWMSIVTSQPSCSRCSKAQRFMLQIYCPLENSKYHRTLYVFCCTQKQCWSDSSGWKVYRDQMMEKVEAGPPIVKGSTEGESWGLGDDDWGDEGFPSPTNGDFPVAEQTCEPEQQMKDEKPLESIVTSLSTQQTYNPRYIDVFNESDLISPLEGDKHIADLISKYETSASQSKDEDLFAGCSAATETYEKNEQKVKNRAFHKFHKKISLLPHQCIRYNYGGSPLLLSDCDVTMSIPPCSSCGKSLTFEFQLLPGLLPTVHIDGEDPVEFGTILVYTCSHNCWGNRDSPQIGGHVVYCPDPDLKFFKSQKFNEKIKNSGV
uniref:programmed cell death protein 2-like n=1 Tax=Ciona intestinalis TaxID=7719 RepID=UPI000180B117|nr:programmed cell death protein 2-like [Ciona intestinalis]|eukprot:XP_002130893.1 programmed cell death protein 2-like [Ciona intestinalis]